jgi:hypothetical protein
MKKRTSSALLLLLPALLLSQPPHPTIAGADDQAMFHSGEDATGTDSQAGPRATMSRRHGFPRIGQVFRDRTGSPARARRIVAIDTVRGFETDRVPPRGRAVPVTEGPWFFAIMRN